ncbi:MAG: hypothetical protein S4CHLAM2_12970 [Chlamydiales bacterium]|nr:hypothetical protein [Chlamydiales bacterium]
MALAAVTRRLVHTAPRAAPRVVFISAKAASQTSFKNFNRAVAEATQESVAQETRLAKRTVKPSTPLPSVPESAVAHKARLTQQASKSYFTAWF